MNKKVPKDEELPRCLLINNLESNIKPQDILSHIKYGSIESYSFSNGTASIIFFSYLDLYLSIKDIQKNNNFPDISIINVPVKQNIKNAHLLGATRCVSINEPREKLSFYNESAINYGEINEISYNNQNGIIIHFLNISSALNFVRHIFNDPNLRNKICFLQDPCCKMKYVENSLLENSFYMKNRTIYLGGITPELTAEDIFNCIKGGDVFSLKIIRDKRCAFIDFVSYHSANAFLAYYTLNELTITKKDPDNNLTNQFKLKVSRGKETNITINSILQSYVGATRAILLCNKNLDLTQEKITTDFSNFGEIELINFIKTKNIIFINFMSINEAFNAYSHYKNDDFYKNTHRMAFGRDRCSNESLEEIMSYVVKKKTQLAKNEE